MSSEYLSQSRAPRSWGQGQCERYYVDLHIRG